MGIMHEVTDGSNHKHGPSSVRRAVPVDPPPRGSGEKIVMKNHPSGRGGKVNDPKEKGSHLGGGKF